MGIFSRVAKLFAFDSSKITKRSRKAKRRKKIILVRQLTPMETKKLQEELYNGYNEDL